MSFTIKQLGFTQLFDKSDGFIKQSLWDCSGFVRQKLKIYFLALLIILIWIGIWSIVDMIINFISGNNPPIKFICYLFITIVSLFLYYIIDNNVV